MAKGRYQTDENVVTRDDALTPPPVTGEVQTAPTGGPPYARYQFVVMDGAVSGQDYTKPILVNDKGVPHPERRRPGKVYKTGTKIWSNLDLVKQYNRGPNTFRFKLLNDYGEGAYTDGIKPVLTPTREPENDPDGVETDKFLNSQNLGDLRRIAAADGVDLEGLETKGEIIKAIKRGPVVEVVKGKKPEVAYED